MMYLTLVGHVMCFEASHFGVEGIVGSQADPVARSVAVLLFS